MITVAAYCRVSTDGKDQANSFAAQQRYFREYIRSQKEWVLYDVYADEGITGTSTKKRTEFNRMLCDARAGRFQLLLTKEVSRFARNILDAIAYTRELKALGVGVVFMSDGINTLEPDAELRLSILSSMAQEESRRTSQRVKWGQTRQMEQGVVFGHSLLGYKVDEGTLTIEPHGAQIVRMIFQKYALEKKGSPTISGELETKFGIHLSANQIMRILKNEKYVGDLVQKKTYTPDYLTHEKKKNQGQEPLIVLRDHHPAVVSRRLWDMVQIERKKRSRQPGTGECRSNRYSLSGKIFCGQCGKIFVSRTKKRKDGSICRRWCCGCGIGKTLNDRLAKEAVLTAIHAALTDTPALAQQTVELVIRAMDETKEQAAIIRKQQTEKIVRKMERILELGCHEEIKKMYDCCRSQLDLIRAQEIEKSVQKDDLEHAVFQILVGSKESESLIRTVLEKITVFQDRHLELYLTSVNEPWVFDYL